MENYWLDPSFEQALVSVIIPCHNQERFLPACLESITEQEYRPIEVLIVDDGSTDRTRQIMNDFKSAHLEGIMVKCLFQSNQGAQQARNQGCLQSRGEFIQFLDGDDLICREKLSEQVQVLNSDREIDVVYGDAQYLIDYFPAAPRKGRIIPNKSTSDIIAAILFGPYATNFSYLSRKSAVERCGPWDNSIEVCQDMEYFLRMALKGSRFHYKKGITGFYRKHSLSTISEQSAVIRGRTWQKVLKQAEITLIEQGEFNDQRMRAAVECYRRIARQTYSIDIDCFNISLGEILRLCPNYIPESRKARFISSIIGLRNYEIFAAVIGGFIYKYKNSWV